MSAGQFEWGVLLNATMHSVLSQGGPFAVMRSGKTIYMLERPVYLALPFVEGENATSAVNQQGSRPL